MANFRKSYEESCIIERIDDAISLDLDV